MSLHESILSHLLNVKAPASWQILSSWINAVSFHGNGASLQGQRQANGSSAGRYDLHRLESLRHLIAVSWVGYIFPRQIQKPSVGIAATPVPKHPVTYTKILFPSA